MKCLFVAGIGILFTVLSSGCRCGCLENTSGNLIDTLTERKISLDCLYRPELDLTRIGKPDWCRSPLNRLLCRDKCSGSCGNSCRSHSCQAHASCNQEGSQCNHCTTGCNPSNSTQERSAENKPADKAPIRESLNKNKFETSSETFFEEIPPPPEDLDRELSLDLRI